MDQDQLVRHRRSTPANSDYYYFDDRSSYPQYRDDLDEILDKYYFEKIRINFIVQVLNPWINFYQVSSVPKIHSKRGMPLMFMILFEF